MDTARTAQSSGGCLCVAFIFALISASSSTWLWRRDYVYSGWTYGSSTVSTGTWVAASSSGSIPCGYYTNCVLVSQHRGYDEFNSTICTGEFYERIGKYGWCDDNMQVQTPSEIKSMRGLSITAAIALFIATISACGAPRAGHADGAKAAANASMCSLIGFVCSTAGYAVAASYEYYQKFNDPWVLPFIDSDDQLQFSREIYLYWGPAFWSLVFVSVVTFFTTFSLCVTAKELKKESGDLDGNNDNSNVDLDGETQQTEGGSSVTKV